MFCPLLSIGKDTRIECSNECAFYNGSIDGISQKECVIFSIGADISSSKTELRDLSKSVDEATETLMGIKLNLCSGK